jgi:ADP-ribose pyrophosphatase YjhB (NUDIX family)
VEWANPVPGVHALIERGGEVLLGRRAFEPGAGCWGLPGGFLEEDEELLDGLRREVREETGLDVEPGDLFGSWLQPHGERTVLCLIFRARVSGGEEKAADDVTELGWFDRAGLPDDIGPSAFADALSAWRHEHA